jgi:oxygen-dependent protoporphyrinogen oxidase
LQDFSAAEKVRVSLSDGSTIDADHVFCALPGAPSASLLAPHSPALADEIRAINYAPVALVTMAWAADVLPQHLVGFGHLVPFKEEEEVLGMTWDSCTFPQQASGAGPGAPTRLTVFVGGTRRADGLRDMARGGVEDIGALARRAVSKHRGMSDAPAVCEVHYMDQAIPQYNVGHTDRIARVERLSAQTDPRLTISGSLLYGVACNDIVAQARQTALMATFR